MKKSFFTTVILLLINLAIRGQGNWVTIYSSRGGFSFSFPQNNPSYDTLGLLTYSAGIPGDSNILFQVNFIDSVSISGNEELKQYLQSRFGVKDSNRAGSYRTQPQIEKYSCLVDSIEAVLVTYAQTYQLTTEGTIEGFVNSDFSPCYIRGKELTIRHPNLSGDAGYYFAFTRYFYWESKFLAFTVSGPEEQLADLYSYKNQLFNSINILIMSKSWRN
jgi:hypothetical protein